MNSKELKEVLVAELGIGELPEDAQNEIISKLGEVILKSMTTTIFEKLPSSAHEEFEIISTKGDDVLIQEFLEANIPDLSVLMEAEVQRVLKLYREGAELPAEI